MNKTFGLLTIAAFGLFAAVPAYAQEATSAAVAPADLAGAGAAVVKHVLVATFIDEGPSGGGLPKGKVTYTFGNTIPVTCTAATCTLEVQAMVQIGQNSTASNSWSICADVDKASDGFVCGFQGTLPTDKTYLIGNYAYSVSLKKGAHTLQPTVFVTAPAVLGSYHIAYRLYQP